MTADSNPALRTCVDSAGPTSHHWSMTMFNRPSRRWLAIAGVAVGLTPHGLILLETAGAPKAVSGSVSVAVACAIPFILIKSADVDTIVADFVAFGGSMLAALVVGFVFHSEA